MGGKFSMKKTFYLNILLLVLVALILSACGGDNSSDNGSGGSDSDDKTLTIAMGTDMLTWDVHDHRNTSTEAIHINVYDYLVNNEDGEFKPNLATEWELIEDDVWEFKLREGVKFHNGDDFTAEDVKFTLERVANDETLRDYQNYRQIDEVEIIDDYTVRIHTDGPEPVLLNRISRLGSGMLPSEYIEEHGWEHFLENPVGSGPYKYVEWIRDDRVVLEINEDHYDGRYSEWDKLVFRAIPENSTRVSEALTGGVDIAANIPPSDWDRIEENDGTSLITGPSNRTMIFFVRHQEGYPTADLRVRQAIDLAIDNQAVIDHVLGGKGTPTITRVNPGNVGVNEDLHNTYNYDVEKAKELMAEAGYEDGFEMTIQSPNGRYPQDRETVEVVAGMLSEIGIEAKLEFMEWGAFVEMRDANENEDMYLLGLSSSLYDSAQSLDYYGSWLAEEHIGYKNEEIDELLQEAEIGMDQDQRIEQYQRVQEIAAEELPHINLHQLEQAFAVSDRINFTPSLDELIDIKSVTSK